MDNFDEDLDEITRLAVERNARPRRQAVSEAAMMAAANMGKVPAPGSPAALRRARGVTALQDDPTIGSQAAAMRRAAPVDVEADVPPVDLDALGGGEPDGDEGGGVLSGLLSRADLFRKLFARGR